MVVMRGVRMSVVGVLSSRLRIGNGMLVTNLGRRHGQKSKPPDKRRDARRSDASTSR